MSLQTAGGSGYSPDEAYVQIRGLAQSIKANAQSALATLQAGNVAPNYIFAIIDSLNTVMAALNNLSTTPNLNTYANSQGYIGTITSDISTCITAAQAVIAWIVNNFPKDSTNTYILDNILNADGTRTARLFNTSQTAGLQTSITNFIATIS